MKKGLVTLISATALLTLCSVTLAAEGILYPGASSVTASVTSSLTVAPFVMYKFDDLNASLSGGSTFTEATGKAYFYTNVPVNVSISSTGFVASGNSAGSMSEIGKYFEYWYGNRSNLIPVGSAVNALPIYPTSTEGTTPGNVNFGPVEYGFKLKDVAATLPVSVWTSISAGTYSDTVTFTLSTAL